MSKRTGSPDSMYSGVPCDKCGGPTLDFPSGSIWCPDEDAHPGGHFVKRVAFERPPTRDTSPRILNATPLRGTRQPVERRASAPTAAPVKVATAKPKDDGFDAGFDSFIEKGDRS